MDSALYDKSFMGKAVSTIYKMNILGSSFVLSL